VTGDPLQALAHLAAEQQLAAGMVAAAVAGAATFSLREIPGKAWKVLQDLLSVTLIVEGSDRLYDELNVWLSRSKAAGKSQRLMTQSDYDYQAGPWGWVLTLGGGWHVLAFDGWPLFVHREVNRADPMAQLLGGAKANQRLWIVAPGRSQRRVRKLVAEAEAIYNGDGLVKVYYWSGGGYRIADRRPPRSLATVFLPAAQKAALVADVETFAGAREVYRARGTPYRRGYLFEGPPGTGKTSLIFALAGHLGRSVYVVNLAAVGGDNDLLAAFNEVDGDGVVVIEDIDTVEITHQREEAAPVAAAVVHGGVPVPAGEAARPRLTLSGLLNAIDGVAAREGRMLFVTSNRADVLDAALLRSGRIDLRERIEPLGATEAWAMFRAFRGEVAATMGEFRALTAGRMPIPAADLQNLLLSPDAHAVREEAAA